jgi:hypothetical protein
MTYEYEAETGNIIDADDGQIIATISDSASAEQVKNLVIAYNAMQNLSLEKLSIVMDCAGAHINDIKSGLEEGMYLAEDNENLPKLDEALVSLEAWHKEPQPGNEDLPQTRESTRG